MIWFSCTKCGKALNRPEASAGAYVFCDCSQGVVVPWESSIQPPAFDTSPPVDKGPRPAVPRLELAPVSEVEIPKVRPAPELDAVPVEAARSAQRSLEACFNHQDRPWVKKCADCGEGFCPDCFLTFQAAVLCGPCKNYRLRQINKPSTICGKAVAGAILAVCCAPVAMCLLPFGRESFALLVGLLALIGQLTAVGLGAIALRETEINPHLSGRSLAITTIVTGGLAVTLTAYFLYAIGL